jgi:hypothetical protein
MTLRPLSGGYACVDTGGGFTGAAIRHLTHSAMNHAFIILDADQGIILEADPGGARLNLLSSYDGMAVNYSHDAVALAPLSAARGFIGVRYGFLDIAYLGLSLGAGWRPKFVLEQALREDRMICSQLVATFGQRHGLDWRCGQPFAQLVTPGLLNDRIL